MRDEPSGNPPPRAIGLVAVPDDQRLGADPAVVRDAHAADHRRIDHQLDVVSDDRCPAVALADDDAGRYAAAVADARPAVRDDALPVPDNEPLAEHVEAELRAHAGLDPAEPETLHGERRGVPEAPPGVVPVVLALPQERLQPIDRVEEGREGPSVPRGLGGSVGLEVRAQVLSGLDHVIPPCPQPARRARRYSLKTGLYSAGQNAKSLSWMAFDRLRRGADRHQGRSARTIARYRRRASPGQSTPFLRYES